MAAFPFSLARWAAPAAAIACVFAASPGFADDPSFPAHEERFGTDSTVAYAHVGHMGKYADAYATGEVLAEWNTAFQAYFQIHADRLVMRLGAASVYRQVSVNDRAFNSRTREWRIAANEASLGLRFGAPDADDGIRIGRMPLQGNPDAVLYGNYLARYNPYPVRVGRRPEAWDSLGSLAPSVTGMRLAVGPSGGPVRGEGWLVRDGDDFSWLAFLSGRAPRRIDWGLGVSGYRAFTPSEKYLAISGNDPVPVSNGGGGPAADSLPPDTVVVTFPHPAILFSARASLDFASLLGAEASHGRYGGVFAEAALVGWQDIPVFYADRWRRLLWTAGARVPTFGWLDACVAQVEWRRSREDVYFYGYGSALWIPGIFPQTRRPSNWTEALLLIKDIGPHAELQAYASTFRDAVGRETQLSGRFAFRFR